MRSKPPAATGLRKIAYPAAPGTASHASATLPVCPSADRFAGGRGATKDACRFAVHTFPPSAGTSSVAEPLAVSTGSPPKAGSRVRLPGSRPPNSTVTVWSWSLWLSATMAALPAARFTRRKAYTPAVSSASRVIMSPSRSAG